MVKFNCHFPWQVQYVEKFGMAAGARNKMLAASAKSNFGCGARCRLMGSRRDHSRIMVRDSRIMAGSLSDRLRIANDVSAVLIEKFTWYFGVLFFGSGLIFGDVGG